MSAVTVLSAGHRRLLVFPGDAAMGRQWVLRQIADGNPADVLWIAAQAPSGIPACAPGRVSGRLGGDCGLLVLDAHQGFHADGFAAAVGLLRGGGDCVVLAPPLREWAGFADPDQVRFAAWPRSATDMPGHFLARLSRLWPQHPAFVPVDPGDPGDVRFAPPGPVSLVLNAQQRQALEAIERVAHGHARRPLVLTADRGRGKSTVLGIAAARLLAGGMGRITVVAPHRAAAATLFEQAQHATGLASRRVGDLTLGSGMLAFRLPVQCLDVTQDDLGLVLVDEAAAIPVAVLAGLLARSNRLVFASTVHGYEGSGRGFELRFRAALDRAMPQWRAMRLDVPVRWAPGDPLEALLNESLLLDAELPSLPLPGPGDGHDGPLIEPVSCTRLAGDDRLLRGVFGLLVNAHYQTRPSDLRQLLDNPDGQLWVARRDCTVVAVAWVVAEGGLDPAIAGDVLAGRRRPRGHLLPQSLAVHAGCDDCLTRRVWRVQRIAVHPAMRRAGLGRALLQHIADAAPAEGIDMLGCAFGVEPDLEAFWRAVGFVPVRIGVRVDPASAEHSLFMLRPVAPAVRALVDGAARAFRDDLPWALSGSLATLDPALAAGLLRGRDTTDVMLDDAQLTALRRIATHARQPATAESVVWKAVVRSAALGLAPPDTLAPLVAWLLQRRPSAEVCARFAIAGQRALDACLSALLDEQKNGLLSTG